MNAGRAFNMGKTAYHRGASQDANPFDQQSHFAHCWRMGFIDARNQDNKAVTP